MFIRVAGSYFVRCCLSLGSAGRHRRQPRLLGRSAPRRIRFVVGTAIISWRKPVTHVLASCFVRVVVVTRRPAIVVAPPVSYLLSSQAAFASAHLEKHAHLSSLWLRGPRFDAPA